MDGIWSLPVNLTGSNFTDSSAVAQIVFQFMFLSGVIFGCYRLPPVAKSIRNGFQSIRYSAYALIVWYSFTIVDLFLHEARLEVAYGYILVYFFTVIPKLAADILLLIGTLRLIFCLISQRLEKPLRWIHVGDFHIIILSVTALYYVGSYLANEMLWLNIADPDIIIEVASRQDKFEAAFFIVQWLLTLYMLISICAALYLGDEDAIKKSGYFAIAATSVLFVRSFSEFIIVIHYHLQQNASSGGTDAARYFVYGLCSTGFLLLISRISEDPSCNEGQDSAGQLIREDIQVHVMNTVNDTVDAGGLPPVLADVFNHVKQDPEAALSAETKQRLQGQNLNAMVNECMKKIEQRHGALRPIDPAREY